MDTGEPIGTLSDRQLRFLIDHLEEEDSEDRDYFITRDKLDLLEEAGCDRQLIGLLAIAMGESFAIDIAWRWDHETAR
jgi:hypothetical protein